MSEVIKQNTIHSIQYNIAMCSACLKRIWAISLPGESTIKIMFFITVLIFEFYSVVRLFVCLTESKRNVCWMKSAGYEPRAKFEFNNLTEMDWRTVTKESLCRFILLCSYKFRTYWQPSLHVKYWLSDVGIQWDRKPTPTKLGKAFTYSRGLIPMRVAFLAN